MKSAVSIKSLADEQISITALSVIPCDKTLGRGANADAACGRFMRSSGLLPAGEFLGWQVSADQAGICRASALSSEGARITKEDCDWIFQSCAAADGDPGDCGSSFFGDDRKVYSLRVRENGSEDSDAFGRRSGCEERAQDCFRDLLDMMGLDGASLRIIAASGTGDRCMILMSLPDVMTLRMRSVLSMVFPGTAAAELSDPGMLVGKLPAKCIMEGMAGLLDEMMAVPKPGEYRVQEDIEWAYDEFCADEEDDEEGFTPIESLELSVRAYNCLKRAGVHSVEKLQGMTEEELSRIRNLGRKSAGEIRQRLAEIQRHAVRPAGKNWSAMLDGLIGLENVKEQVRKITAFARMKKDMERLHKGAVPMVLNMEFTGNPGTAKTTVARIMAGILSEAGLLESSEPVEVGRADLVARYEGQTADKVRSVFRQAKGRLLFIDEAYSLVECAEGEFGDEAINTIVQEMENSREDTVVIFAGYPDKMERFFSRNPGLRSRVPFSIRFRDYSAEEMVQIVELEAAKRGFSVGEEAKKKVLSVCRTDGSRPDAGNGRFCRNLAESAILGYASRVYGDREAVGAEFELSDQDFVIPDRLCGCEARKIGFEV